MQKGKFILLFVGFFVLIHFSFAQSYKFRLYTYKNGLPQDYIYTMVQTKKGDLWIGTGEGLARFNGKGFYKFSAKEGFENNFVTASFKDKNENIWIGHFNGVISFYNNNKFSSLPLETISQSPITVFYQDKKGNIWVGTKGNGLLKITENNKVEVFNDFFNASITAIQEDGYGNLLIATEDGIYSVRSTNAKLIQNGIFLKDKKVTSLKFFPKKKILFAGTAEKGLFKARVKNAKDILFQAVPAFSEGNINLIVPDKEGYIWISSFGNGVFKCANEKNISIKEHYCKNSGLVSNYVKSLYIDRENNVWFGTYGSGLSLLLNPIFTLYTRLDGLADNNAQTVGLSKDGTIWVGSEDKISYLPKGATTFKYIPEFKFPSKISSLLPLDSFLLVGTEEKGIFACFPKRKKIIPWFNPSNSHLQNKINYMILDKEQNIWIATDGGVLFYNRKTRNFSHFTMQEGLPHNKIYSLFCDKKGNVWMATRGGGLACYFKGKIAVYPSPLEGRSLEINCFAEDKLGRLWIGSYGQGFFLFKKGKFLKNISTKEGLPSPYCYFLFFDNNNMLWIGHKTGLSKYNPQKSKFVFYENQKENSAGDVNNYAVTNDTYGNLWFGTVNGLIKYNPKADKINPSKPIVNLVSLLLNFKEIDWRQYADSLSGFGKIPHNLRLPYDKNHLSFNVIGISLNPNAGRMAYRYKLEGFEKDWSLITNESFVTYSNLPPGKYSLRVMAGNKDGEWAEMAQPFSFIIRSPFWSTWWFLFFSFIGVVASVSGIIKLRTERLRQQKEKLKQDKALLEAEVRQRIIAQEQQKVVEEKLKETNLELNNFIYRSSHDLRGPISTIKGLTQLGTMEVKDPNAQRFFGLIQDRTNTLDAVLKNLINIVEIIESEITIHPVLFDEMCKVLYSTMQEQDKLKNFNLTLHNTYTGSFYNNEKLILTILENLIDNSIKYQNSQREPFACVTIKPGRTGAIIITEDNGIGISNDLKTRIFDMFYRGVGESKGFGLGLYTVKKIVEKLSGDIELKSTAKGTKITIFLPDKKQAEPSF